MYQMDLTAPNHNLTFIFDKNKFLGKIQSLDFPNEKKRREKEKNACTKRTYLPT